LPKPLAVRVAWEAVPSVVIHAQGDSDRR